jgi:VWFA-related protein
MTRSTLVVAGLVAVALASAAAQSPSPQTAPAAQAPPASGPASAPAPASGQPAPVFRTGTSAVLLDIVVRDRRGRPIRDLRQDEIAVLEDGAPREVKAFRLVEGTPAEAGVATPGTPGVTQPDPLRRITLVSLVFDHLSLNGRKMALKAAREYLAKPMPAGQWAAVFTLDNRLHMQQDFTRDSAALTAAVERASTAIKEDGPPLPGSSRERGREANQELANVVSNTAMDAAGGAAAGAASADAQMRRFIQQMQSFAAGIESSQRGHATFYPLMALAKAQGALEGRKAILLFSEGLQVPSSVEEAFQAAISEANRANVSFYTIDARGLDTNRDLAAAGDALNRAGRVSQQAMAKRGADGTSMEEVQNDDLVLSSFRADSQSTLRQLAEDTGGVLVGNTNDLGKGLERVTSDLASYYEIAYAPQSGEADGRFRKIEVKVTRRGVDVTSRSGYFALPATDTMPLLPFELPLLAAAAASPLPHTFDFDAGVFRFHETPKGRQFTLIAELQTADVTVQEDAKAKRYRANVTVMALVKDATGTIVERLSRAYPLEGPLQNLEALKRGRLLVKQQFWLPAGRYTVTAVIRDQLANRASVKQVPVRVFPESPGIDVSTVAVVKRIDKASEQPDAVEDPFRDGPMRIVPSLSTPISKAANSQISAYVVLYPDKTLADPASLTIEFAQGSTVIGRSTPALDKPDEHGRITCVATFPAEGFAPGRYELRAIARQGGSQDETRTTFTIVQ